MALTDQPYFPLYSDDYLSDEKLRQCDPESEGIYIRIMCNLHKSKEYGMLRLTEFDKAKLKQKVSKTEAKPEQKEIIASLGFFLEDFMMMVLKTQSLVGRETLCVTRSLIDLIGNDVLQFDGKVLSQKRMLKDGEISKKRAIAAEKKTKKPTKTKNKPKTNPKQNTVNGIVNETGVDIGNKTETENKEKLTTEDFQQIKEIFNSLDHEFPKIKSITASRKSAIKARAKEHSLETIGTVFKTASASEFLNGNSENGWKADFDWIMKPNNFLKILEGNYENKTRRQQNGNNNTDQYADYKKDIARRLSEVQSG